MAVTSRRKKDGGPVRCYVEWDGQQMHWDRCTFYVADEDHATTTFKSERGAASAIELDLLDSYGAARQRVDGLSAYVTQKHWKRAKRPDYKIIRLAEGASP